ncbi:uncharacterized protein C8R40DRAFT_1205162 [Lentinula edodes]|uniref:uncharacterized protein n=1 Tax=Lentinula edodes TaxID=5353 RepID=UPI001E8D54C6|nr:uncharacterized protein C8R40DRAFT_1205162 [Lentinula edodes]KAH7872181.1 hypothetical protein C8R40DRAFT_1205162 [Lentinula edodes]
MSDEGLKEVLGHGVGYYNETLSEQDTIVQRLFQSEDELDAVSPLNLGMITEHLNISSHRCHSRSHLYDRLPRKLNSSSVNYEFTHFKTFLLLQAHFSRIHLPAELITNQRLILEKILNLLSACVDMCVQAVWERDSPLKQIPHFEAEVIRRCADAGLESVYDVMGYGGWKCIDIEVLKMSNAQMQDVAAFELVKGTDDDDQTVIAPFYPTEKMLNRWLVLLVIKRVTIDKTLTVKLEFTLPKGKHPLKLYSRLRKESDEDSDEEGSNDDAMQE